MQCLSCIEVHGVENLLVSLFGFVGLVVGAGCGVGDSSDANSNDEVGETSETSETGETDGEPIITPCDGNPAAAWLEIQAPLPPLKLTKLPPRAWTYVHDTPSLQAAVNEGAPYIELATGVYDEFGLDDAFLRLRGQQLWAEDFGQVRLAFGVQAGGNDQVPGQFGHTELHGLVFDIHDASHAASGGQEHAAIMAWGDATDFVIEDSVVHGNDILSTGVFVSSADGMKLARVRVMDTQSYGLLVSGPTPTAAAEIEDLRISGIRGGEGSTSGVGLRLESRAEVRRIFVRDVRFAGIATLGKSTSTTLSHVDIDRIGLGDTLQGGVGVYFDDTTRSTTLEHFCIGPNTKFAINSEWDHHTDTDLGHPVAIGNVVRHGLSEAWYTGVHFDQGTVRGEVFDVVFRNYQRAGILFHANVSEESLWPDYDDGSVEHDNVFEVAQVDCEVCDVSLNAWNDPGPVVCVGGSDFCPPPLDP